MIETIKYCRAYINTSWRYFLPEQIIKEFKRGKNKGRVKVEICGSRYIIPRNEITFITE